MSIELKLGFGSFGDIVAIIDLAWKLCQLLASTRGADLAYQELLIEVGLLHDLLQDIHPMLRMRDYSILGLQWLSSAEKALDHLIKECGTLLKTITYQATDTKQRLNNTRHSWWSSLFITQSSDLWSKVGWAVLGPKRIAEWTAKLQGIRQSMTTLILVSTQ